MKTLEKKKFNRLKFNFQKILLCFLVTFFIFTPILNISAVTEALKAAQEGLIQSAGSDGAELTTVTTAAVDNNTVPSSKAEIKNTVVKVIGFLLSFMGIMLLINLIFAGYSWMNSGGNEESIKKAKGKITSSIIGLLIVLAAYIGTALIFESLGMVIGP